MAFEIDTGPSSDPLWFIPGWFRDQADNFDDPALVRMYGMHLLGGLQEPRSAVGWLRRPKRNETVRKHLLADWAFLRALGEAHPDTFDSILAAYAERIASE